MEDEFPEFPREVESFDVCPDTSAPLATARLRRVGGLGLSRS